MGVIVNYREFYKDLNRVRRMRGDIAWNKVAIRAGVQPSGISVFVSQFEKPAPQTAKTLSLETFVRLLHWMRKTDITPYLVDEDDATI